MSTDKGEDYSPPYVDIMPYYTPFFVRSKLNETDTGWGGRVTYELAL